MNQQLRRYERLLSRSLTRYPSATVNPPLARKSAIAKAQDLGIELPEDLLAALEVANGTNLGPGGIFGLDAPQQYLDIREMYDDFPVWKQLKWVPIAADGSGNYYVAIPHNGNWPVVFVEGGSPGTPQYVAASSVIRCLTFLLEKELNGSPWPFLMHAVLSMDPDIVDYEALGLPWKVE